MTDSTFTDRLGLPIGTTDDNAAAHYKEGVDLYMSGNPGGEAALRDAMTADPGFALAPAALTRRFLSRLSADQLPDMTKFTVYCWPGTVMSVCVIEPAASLLSSTERVLSGDGS